MTFRFNKTTSQLTSTIEMATDGQQKETEDWLMFMTICDLVNSTDDGPKEAVKAIKKRFNTKHSPSILLTLSLLESLVKNCGLRLHVVVCTKEFMSELMKVISPKNNYSIALQNTVLSLIQNWSLAFRHQPELKEVTKTYEELKAKGVEFPAVNQDNIAQYILSPQAAGNSTLPQQKQHRPNVYHSEPLPQLPLPPHQIPQQQQLPQQQLPQHQPQHQQSQQQLHQPQQLTTTQQTIPQHKIDKLRCDIGLVRKNGEKFGELLTVMMDGKSVNEGDASILNELKDTCTHMQARILQLIQQVQLETLTGELLQCNDELNNQFVRYQRYTRSQQQQTNNNTTASSAANNNIKSNNNTATNTTTTHIVAVDNLIDFSDNTVTNNDNIPNNTLDNNISRPNLPDRMNDLNLNGPQQNFDPFSLLESPGKEFQNQTSRETEVREMEEWLKANEAKGASTQEFERFLEERVIASNSIPDNDDNLNKVKNKW